MTSRYRLVSPPEAVRAHFGLAGIDAFPPREAIAPTEPVAIVRRAHAGHRELHLVRWGLIPGWVKDPSGFATLFSARAETAADKPSFRGGLRHRRCLVPADGFYVWSGEKGRRTAALVHLREGGLMAMAAIADHWLGADGSELETMAVLTVAADAVVAPLADRMPALIQPVDFERWLDCRGGEAVSVVDLIRPPSGSSLVAEAIAGPLRRARLKGGGAA